MPPTPPPAFRRQAILIALGRFYWVCVGVDATEGQEPSPFAERRKCSGDRRDGDRIVALTAHIAIGADFKRLSCLKDFVRMRVPGRWR